MSILSELNVVLGSVNIPLETGHYSGKPPREYIIITPLSDTLELYADDAPHTEVEEARLSLFSKNNYIKLKKQITKLLLNAGFFISDRRYIGFEDDTKYHHYAIDVAKEYQIEEE